MSELISRKEALIALANGEEVELQPVGDMNWYDSTQWTVGELLCFKGRFRLKPRTITINGIEVPAPFDGSLKHKQYGYVLNTVSPDGYSSMKFYEGGNQPLICWTDEEEIKQVAEALRNIFGKK